MARRAVPLPERAPPAERSPTDPRLPLAGRARQGVKRTDETRRGHRARAHNSPRSEIRAVVETRETKRKDTRVCTRRALHGRHSVDSAVRCSFVRKPPFRSFSPSLSLSFEIRGSLTSGLARDEKGARLCVFFRFLSLSFHRNRMKIETFCAPIKHCNNMRICCGQISNCPSKKSKGVARVLVIYNYYQLIIFTKRQVLLNFRIFLLNKISCIIAWKDFFVTILSLKVLQ